MELSIFMHHYCLITEELHQLIGRSLTEKKKQGVTTFFIDEKIDTGAIIMSKKVNIKDGTTAGELHNQLMELGAEFSCQYN